VKPKARIVVLDGFTLNPGDLSWGVLAELGTLTVHDRTPPSEIVARALHHDLVLTNKTQLTRATFEQLPELKAVCVLATGFNIVDVACAKERQIPVCNVPSYATESVAQATLALLLELASRVGVHAAAVQQGDWARSLDFSFQRAPLLELSGKLCGIVGFGTIGRRFAELAHALGMRVWATPSRSATAPSYAHFEFKPLEELLSAADVVSLHCPLTRETEQLINAEKLALMKPTALLLNTSRGPLIDEAALALALQRGALAGAGLDVLSTEPPSAANPLLLAPNCVITPHIAWASFEARQRLMQATIENVRAFLAGAPRNAVNL